MNVRAERNRAQRQRISKVGRDIVARGDSGGNQKTDGRENVTQLAVRIFNKSDAGGPVRVVFNRENFRGHTAFAPFEIDLAISLFVPAPDVTRSQPAVVVTAAGSFLRLDQTLGRLPFRDLLESRKRLKAQRRGEWAKAFQCHIKRGRSW